MHLGWTSAALSLSLDDFQSRAIFTSVTIDSKRFHRILNRLTHLCEFNPNQMTYGFPVKQGIIVLMPLVLWFESVAWVNIQPLLALEHFFWFSGGYRLCFQKGTKAGSHLTPMFKKDRRTLSTNPMDLQENKCSYSQSQFWLRPLSHRRNFENLPSTLSLEFFFLWPLIIPSLLGLWPPKFKHYLLNFSLINTAVIYSFAWQEFQDCHKVSLFALHSTVNLLFLYDKHSQHPKGEITIHLYGFGLTYKYIVYDCKCCVWIHNKDGNKRREHFSNLLQVIVKKSR